MTLKDMLGRSGAVTREEALKRILSTTPLSPPSTETTQPGASLGRVLAEDIRATADLPEFDRSTMDGYAVRSADTFGATESLPALLTVIGDIPMGSMPDGGIAKGQAMKIATGGALPQGADSVLMLEHAQTVDERAVEAVKPVAPGENVVQVGDDLRRGDIALGKGRRIRPQDMGALASLGITSVPVYAVPRVAIISTGNEIVSADSIPQPGKIRDSNSCTLVGLIIQSGGVPVHVGIIPDDFDRLRIAVGEALGNCQLVILTGGSSVGTADHTARVIESFGPPGVQVHGVSVKPGKPLIAGWAGGVPVFGLPGHPVAVAISFDLFVRPLLVRLSGEVPHPALENVPVERIVRAKLARSITSGPGREEHVRVALERRDGVLTAVPVFGGSGLISTLVKADGIVVVPLHSIGIEAGEDVEVRLF